MTFGELDAQSPVTAGWCIYPFHRSLFQSAWYWTAYGPNGSDCGTASSEDDARDRALEAHRRLQEVGR